MEAFRPHFNMLKLNKLEKQTIVPRQTPMIFVNSFVRMGSFLYPIFVAPLTHSIENRN